MQNLVCLNTRSLRRAADDNYKTLKSLSLKRPAARLRHAQWTRKRQTTVTLWLRLEEVRSWRKSPGSVDGRCRQIRLFGACQFKKTSLTSSGTTRPWRDNVLEGVPSKRIWRHSEGHLFRLIINVICRVRYLFILCILCVNIY